VKHRGAVKFVPLIDIGTPTKQAVAQSTVPDLSPNHEEGSPKGIGGVHIHSPVINEVKDLLPLSCPGHVDCKGYIGMELRNRGKTAV